MFDSGVLLWGEIRCYSLLGAKGLIKKPGMTSLELHCCSSLQCSEQMNNEEKKCKERAIVKQDLFNWSIKWVLFTGVAKDLKPRSLAC